jgi:ABC-2 type transport system ATP-binding protein
VISGFFKEVTVDEMVNVSGLTKIYAGDTRPALKDVNLEIPRGEIFALLGENGAGKSTLINLICGITAPTRGSIRVNGHDMVRNGRAGRASVGLMPQELCIDWTKTVWQNVVFSRGLFGMSPDNYYLENLIRGLVLWDKKDTRLSALSGGMRRRVLLAKALAHQPKVLFLDEPTAGVDLELRRKLWDMVSSLRRRGLTVVLTTHYIEEAEEMADRVAVIRKGEIILVKEKKALMEEFGRRTLVLKLCNRLLCVPTGFHGVRWTLSADGYELTCVIEGQGAKTDVPGLLRRIQLQNIEIGDIETTKSSLEEIYVELLRPFP